MTNNLLYLKYLYPTRFHFKITCIFTWQRAQDDEIGSIKKHIQSAQDKGDAKPLDKPEQ